MNISNSMRNNVKCVTFYQVIKNSNYNYKTKHAYQAILLSVTFKYYNLINMKRVTNQMSFCIKNQNEQILCKMIFI